MKTDTFYGKPIIKGAQVFVNNILCVFALPKTIEQVMKAFTNINRENIYADLFWE